MNQQDESIFPYRASKGPKFADVIFSERRKSDYEKITLRTHAAGYVDAYIYRPQNRSSEALPVVFNLHGGGFVLGFCEQDAEYCRQLANATNSAVINVDYPLAPEFKFPYPIDAITELIKEVKRSAKELALSMDQIGILGSSAGGGLAAAVTMMLTKSHNIHVKELVLNYPLLDWREFVTAEKTNQVVPSISRLIDYMHWYLRTPDDALDPLASPILSDLTQLPNTLVIGAGLDPLFAQSERLCTQARKLGTSITFKEFPNCGHGFTHRWFDTYQAEAASKAWRLIAEFLSQK